MEPAIYASTPSFTLKIMITVISSPIQVLKAVSSMKKIVVGIFG